MLDMNSLEERIERLNLSKIDVTLILEDLISSYLEQAAAKGIKLNYQKSFRLPEIISEPNFINRIFDNLISNAIKFSYPNSNVYVKIYEEKEQLVVTVTDEGQGIKKEEQTLLFQKFKRLSSRPTGGENSTGLGLAIVKNLIDKLHATIEYSSEFGKGTTFIVKFQKQMPKDIIYKDVL
jgi:signal transduction histidine kinase